MIQIAPDDRGFTLGHGLFETLLADASGLHDWPAHIARLQRGCAALGLPAPDESPCRAAAETALHGAGAPSGRWAVRLNWSAGPGGRGLDPPDEVNPRLAVTVAPIGPPALNLTLRHSLDSAQRALADVAPEDPGLSGQCAGPPRGAKLGRR